MTGASILTRTLQRRRPHATGDARRRRWPAWALAVLPAVALAALIGVRLDAQGLYYDELHQATGAFTYLGSPPEYFARAPVGGIPLLNMPYSGAIKTAVYGLYLRLVRPAFGVVSWRLVGVAFVAAGLIVFTALAPAQLSPVPLAVVLGLLLTDQTILLGVRHDWGPIALSLALRLALLAIWLRGELAARPSLGSSAALGALAGVMTFEKLNAGVMIPVLAVMLLTGRRRSRRHLLAAGAGLLAGLAPLVAVNAASLLTDGRLISLSDMGTVPERSWEALRAHAQGYVRLAAGERVWHFILGGAPLPLARRAEAPLLLLALGLAAALCVPRPRTASARCALTALGCWLAIGVALAFFPRRTGVHHWVMGTPFQYLAIGLALDATRRAGGGAAAARGALRWLLVAVVGGLLAVRLAGVCSLEQALWRGDSSRAWDPSLTALGRFAAARADTAVFAAADWGVATQIYCLSNGRPGLVDELFWSYRGPADLLALQQRSGATELYALALAPPSGVRREATARIFRDLAASPHWQELAPEPAATDLTAVTVRRFRYLPGRDVDVRD